MQKPIDRNLTDVAFFSLEPLNQASKGILLGGLDVQSKVTSLVKSSSSFAHCLANSIRFMQIQVACCGLNQHVP